MEYLLSRNYGNFAVGEFRSNERAAVMIGRSTFEHLTYGGIIEMKHCENGMLTYFRKNPSYRDGFEEAWRYTDDSGTILAFVQDLVVYIVVGEDGMPVIVPRDMSTLPELEIKHKEPNVVLMFK